LIRSSSRGLRGGGGESSKSKPRIPLRD
jgi:hypothetical protein